MQTETSVASVIPANVPDGYGLTDPITGMRYVPKNKHHSWALAEGTVLSEQWAIGVGAAMHDIQAMVPWDIDGDESALKTTDVIVSVDEDTPADPACSVVQKDRSDICILGLGGCHMYYPISDTLGVCTQWKIDLNKNNVHAIALSDGTVTDVEIVHKIFMHEFGHTLGLNHADEGIMQPNIPDVTDPTKHLRYTECELSRLEHYLSDNPTGNACYEEVP